ncbi:hypothetical protein [Burkholderia gladioli]|uniref:hypothetical protein n=1 Tax=Burkholderia gladioli TaxID=28095 RepID=UPI003EDEEB99
MDVFSARRRHLKHLIDSEYGGSQKRFADHVGIKPSQISRWVSTSGVDSRNISETSARNIEALCGKQQGWLDSADLIGEGGDEDATGSSERNKDDGKSLLLNAWTVAGECARREALMWAKTVLAAAADHQGG